MDHGLSSVTDSFEFLSIRRAGLVEKFIHDICTVLIKF